MKLLQTQNPNIVPLIVKWWHKYLRKIKTELEEGELLKLAGCFGFGADNRLFVLMDEKKKEIHGFCVVNFDNSYNAIIIYQMATDRREDMKRELLKLKDSSGATAIYFTTERNPKAWQRLAGVKPVGYLMELTEEG